MSRAIGLATLLLMASPSAIAQAPAAPVGARLMAPGLPVADLDRSLAFYRIALGLVAGTTLHHGALTEAMLCADDARGPLALILLHDGGPGKATGQGGALAKIVLRVPDVAAVAARMTAAGYPVGAVRVSGEGPAILMIVDPDGYQLELVGGPAPALSH